MRKLILSTLLLLFVQVAFSQKANNGDKRSLAMEESKLALVSKLNLTSQAADMVIVTETEFFDRLAAIKALGDIPVTEKEKKLHAAHTTRRSNLMSIPLTGRQMEDVVEVVESIRRKHDL